MHGSWSVPVSATFTHAAQMGEMRHWAIGPHVSGITALAFPTSHSLTIGPFARGHLGLDDTAEQEGRAMIGADVAFWLIATALVAGAGLFLFLGVLRADPTRSDGAANDLRIYRDQLSEIDRDVTRGVLAGDEATRLKTEVSRRILDADRVMTMAGVAQVVTRGPTAGLWLAGIALAAAFGLYGWLGAPGYPDLPMSYRLARADAAHNTRPSQAEAEASADQPRQDPTDADMAVLINRLRQAVADRPDDLAGHELLAQNEAALGNHAAAAAALADVVRIKGEKATAGDFAKLADAYVSATGGYVSPEAEAALNAVLERDAGNGAARFYSGLMYAQTLRPDLAFTIWRDLLEKSPPDAPWGPVIAARIADLAAAAGVDYAPPAAVKGPSSGDIAAAGEMSATDRKTMIEGMVAGLHDRLMKDGGTADEWVQLMTALGVLGDKTRATAAWAKAQRDLAADTGALARVAEAAKTAGVGP